MGKKLALIIGNTEYIDPGLAQLIAPGKDAEDFGRVLKNENLCAFDDVRILLNQVSSSVIEVIDEFFDQKKPDDLLVLYFSGHGVRDEFGSLYLAFKNTIRSRLRSTAIKADYIKEAMDQSRSKRQVLILDCCNSGAFPQGTKAEVGGVMGLTQAFQGYGRFVLTASDATQFAWEGNKVIGETENSLFTHFLVKGLEGEADSDGDGKITVDELYDYAFEEVSKVTPKQTPTKSASKVEGEIILRHITRLEDIRPVSLPDELLEATEDSRTFVREGAVLQLEKLLKGKNLGLARSARAALERMEKEDDSRRVSQFATQVLESIRQAEQLAIQKAEEERLAAEKAEADRLAKQKAEEHLALEKAEAHRKVKEKAERRLAEQKAEERMRRKEAEQTALVKEQEERQASEKAKAERKAREQARIEAVEKAQGKIARRAEREVMERPTHKEVEKQAQEEIDVEEKKPYQVLWMRPEIIGPVVIVLVLISFASLSYLNRARPTPPPETEVPATEAPAGLSGEPAEASTEAPVSEQPADVLGGTATITFVIEPDSLNPLYTDLWFSNITRDFWLKGLWSFDENNQLIPELAAEIPTSDNGGMSEDGLTLRINLRDDVIWSDGEPVTANDFVFTYEMYMADANTVISRYPYEDFVASVEAVDDVTFYITFSEPFAAWRTSIFSDGVLPEHILRPVFEADRTLDNAEWNTAPTVGVGPFVFKEWEVGSHMIFEANPNWINPPKLEQIFIRVTDDAAQEAAILAGDTDIGTFLDWGQAEAINNSGNAKLVTQPAGFDEGWYLNFDPATAHPGMLDLNVRLALVLATDREKIIQDLLGGLTEVPVTYWSSTPPYEDPSLASYPYDPEEAARLLDEAGWVDSNGDGTRDKNGTELVLRYIANQRQLRKDVQALVQEMWAQVGIGVELANYGDNYFSGYADGGPQATGQYDIAAYSHTGDFPDPYTSKWLCSEVTSPDNPDGRNWQGYCNPDVDALFEQQATETNLEARKQLYSQIQQIMQNDVVWVGLWKDPDLWAVGNRLQGVRLSGITPFWNAHQWNLRQ